jgi:tetratricopeptide (TPR) repeat protein
MLSILLTIALMAANQAGTLSGTDLLQRGKDNFRAAQYAHAVDDLRAAADALLSAEQKESFVTTGKIETLPQLEESLVYLTVAYTKLGRDDDARETLSRLAAAERIESHYATLPLTGDVSDFPSIATRLSPALQLPLNPQLASAQPLVQPPTAVAMQTPPPVAPPMPVPQVAAAPQPVPTPMPAPPPAVAIAAQPGATVLQSDREAIMREVEKRVAEARAQWEKEMTARLAAEHTAMQKQLDERIAEIESQSRHDVLGNIRRADILANTGHLTEANEIYTSIANATAATREAITEAGIGLYRTGSYSDAANALRRLSTFARGEEDIRYYYAVSLYETGNVDEASRQLACALPFIQRTEAVERYEAKIEAAASRQASR